ncbi:hypothetical protein EVAR_17147_1 [Eumeta japonica]|uniref:Uncharacterized protein n=1 Tax=Eumeta variegata TaxID=151549 RepID=A0A4C1ULZ2_EUMVA|nr:hypothetical protein EVAR_17147_1 [Eumeta japonica]
MINLHTHARPHARMPAHVQILSAELFGYRFYSYSAGWLFSLEGLDGNSFQVSLPLRLFPILHILQRLGTVRSE